MRRLLAAAIVLTAAATAAQDTQPQFEAASIKPSAGPASAPARAPGRTIEPYTTLALLIEYAYGLPARRVVAGPDWMRSTRVAIAARAATPAPLAELRLMMRQLLAQRFALKTHLETREMPVYALVRSRRDGSLGPNIRPATAADCAAQPDDRPACGTLRVNYPSQITGVAVPLSQLARNLGDLERMLGLDRLVVDQTDLRGNYMIEMQFAEQAAPGAGTTELPSFFTAMQEQLGLKLDARRAPVDVLVVDSASLPTFD